MMPLDLAFSPLIGWLEMAIFALLALGAILYARLSGLTGGGLRITSLALILLAAANPILVRHSVIKSKNIVALIIDDSASQSLSGREAQTQQAIEHLERAIARYGDSLELRLYRTQAASPESDGTYLGQTLRQAMAEIPEPNLAGLILITDGQVHDADHLTDLGLKKPVHVLLTGDPDDRDRAVRIETSPAFAMIGQNADLGVRIVSRGESGMVGVTIRRDGMAEERRHVPLNSSIHWSIPITHSGQTSLDLSVEHAPKELSTANNHAVLTISGVRQSLKVLLISGAPSLGERTWRDVLSADPAIELVHFTILRPPEKDDNTPLNELALITFPIGELLQDKLAGFDLIILDRCQRLTPLPEEGYRKLADYVKQGGAVLTISGPDYIGEESLWRSPLSEILPARPEHKVLTQAFQPHLSERGHHHPITAPLPEPEQWGPWLRMVESSAQRGQILMTGPQNWPLLVIDRVEKGRVGQILSDSAWLWAKDYRGGGPYRELMTRLMHWLMAEPALEDDLLTARVQNHRVEITRSSPVSLPVSVTLSSPDGQSGLIPLTASSPITATGTIALEKSGLYTLQDGDKQTFFIIPPPYPLEEAEPLATTERLLPLTRQTGGTIIQLWQTNTPDLRLIQEPEQAWGKNWIGLYRNEDRQRRSATPEQSAWPLFLIITTLLISMAVCWKREGQSK